MGNLATPKSVQKLQTALHAKAKAEAGYRFYALYDKISRDDILAHAYAQCRSNKGAPGVDGQDFAVPNYRLEECHNGDAAFQSASTLTLRTALQALHYALWDSDLERLVPFASPPPLNRCLRHINRH